ncbi:MarR family winged helix-turn-helix transcriptional regulator [Microbacterium xanthum]|uniref:MarR family winged helix-turn-helix transcriptional regulator n=1 Tax=Microbacterium xanthum TaxID=3079794 RepID=UPI002AD31BDF|nr:MarR family transcriptional regulator [Microbacterium sp. KSW-48]MDZ8170953.1 MarR family transcriptional regulator [Microbacterium sp. KSW-48]
MADRLTFTLHELVAEIDAYADDALRTRHGVTFSVFEFLAVLANAQPADMTTLARCLGVTKAAVSKRVPALVEQGWVLARNAPGEGRSIRLSLTSRGADLVRIAGDDLEAEFLSVIATSADAGGIAALNGQLNTLTDLFRRKNSAPPPTNTPHERGDLE